MKEELILFDEFEQNKNINKPIYCDKRINEIFNNIKIVYKLLNYNFDVEISNIDIAGKIDDNLINIYYIFTYFDIYKFEVKFLFRNIYNLSKSDYIFKLDHMRINGITSYSLFYYIEDDIIIALEELLKKI